MGIVAVNQLEKTIIERVQESLEQEIKRKGLALAEELKKKFLNDMDDYVKEQVVRCASSLVSMASFRSIDRDSVEIRMIVKEKA